MTTGPNDPQGQDNQGTGDPQIIHSLIVHSNGVEYELDPKGKEFPTDAYEYPKGTIVRIIVKNVPDGKELVEGHALEVVMDEDKSFTLELQDELPVLPPLPAKAKVTMTVVPNGGSYTLTPEGDKVGDDQYEFDEGTVVVVKFIPPDGKKPSSCLVTWEGHAPQEVVSTGELTVPAMPMSAVVELVFEEDVPVVPPTPPEDDKSSLLDRPVLDELDGVDDDLGGGTPAPAPNTGSVGDQQPPAPAPAQANEPPEQVPARNASREEFPGGQQPPAPAPSQQNQRWGWVKILLAVLAVLLIVLLVVFLAFWATKGVSSVSQEQGALEGIQGALEAIEPGEEWTFHGVRSQDGKSVHGTFNKTSTTGPGQVGSPQDVDEMVFDRGRQHSVSGSKFWDEVDPRMEELETKQAETDAKVEALQTDVAEIKEDIGAVLEVLRQQAPQQPN
jgi:hypothetical protein